MIAAYKTNVPSEESFFNPKTTALKLALKRMFESHCFSICTIDDCLKLTGCIPKAEIYSTMRVVHCVPFMDMEPPFPHWLFEQTILLFSKPQFNISKFELLEDQKASLYLPVPNK